jgi:hypothetical protein
MHVASGAAVWITASNAYMAGTTAGTTGNLHRPAFLLGTRNEATEQSRSREELSLGHCKLSRAGGDRSYPHDDQLVVL